MLVSRRFQVILMNNVGRMFRLMCSKNSSKKNEILKMEKQNETDELELPSEPENCCMSGCENCVWKKYATDLTELYKDSGEKAKKIILQKIKDPSMQVFLKMELEFLDKKK